MCVCVCVCVFVFVCLCLCVCVRRSSDFVRLISLDWNVAETFYLNMS